ncbi:protein kintoun [Pempheris klunzingeri]|uniref:protein kintoun n=1 Tax=Pempheris klunzingeri TaxID=3127111 RepID=UPI00397FA70D
MEAGEKLKELNMTVDEIDRLTKAFKDEKFKEMLRDYARELSDPENKKKYEEEIKLLEQERGNTIDFIHPEPFKALKTSVNGKQKCFINICSNEKVGKPECKWGESEDGRRGQCWSLPHSLHPGKQDTDPKGNKFMIYDVIFHPDTLHVASKNKRFMDMVDSTAMQAVQDAFKVTLDKSNVREMSMKYKGTLQPCVIRKPIPGYKPKVPPEKPDPLAFQYPDEKRLSNPTESPAAKDSSESEPKSFQIHSQKAKEPTKPNYAVRYRSFIDLQDFRCSRDSGQSPRPKEIVVTIDLPLLKAVTDASLEVKERRLLLLESKKPAYRLELPLAYPVDEDKGEAKFNRQRGQLIVTLPVLPSDGAFEFTAGPAETDTSDGERQEEKSEAEQGDKWEEEEEREGQKSDEEEVEEERGVDEEDLKQPGRVGKDEEEEERGVERGEEQQREGENSEEEEEEEEIGAEMAKRKRDSQNGVEEEKQTEQKWENETEVGKLKLQKWEQHEEKNDKLREDGCDRAAEKKDSGVTQFQCDAINECRDASAEEENSHVASPETENKPLLISAEHSSSEGKEGDISLNTEEETEKMGEDVHADEEVEADAAFLHHSSTEGHQTATASPVPALPQSQDNMKDRQRTEESSEMPATHKADRSSGAGSGSGLSLCSEGGEATSSSRGEEKGSVDEDDLSTQQVFQRLAQKDEPPPVLLREIDEDGNEKIISDHTTSAGFVFQNSLMYELD